MKEYVCLDGVVSSLMIKHIVFLSCYVTTNTLLFHGRRSLVCRISSCFNFLQGLLFILHYQDIYYNITVSLTKLLSVIQKNTLCFLEDRKMFDCYVIPQTKMFIPRPFYLL